MKIVPNCQKRLKAKHSDTCVTEWIGVFERIDSLNDSMTHSSLRTSGNTKTIGKTGCFLYLLLTSDIIESDIIKYNLKK